MKMILKSLARNESLPIGYDTIVKDIVEYENEGDLVERDLRIYMDYLDGHLYHFRDNTSGDEVDAILEFKSGECAAVEIKLNYRSIDETKQSLLKFYNNVSKKPKFMCIIVGNFSAIIKDKATGIYIIPITALKP